MVTTRKPCDFQRFAVFYYQITLSGAKIRQIFDIVSNTNSIRHFLPFDIYLFAYAVIFCRFGKKRKGKIQEALKFFTLVSAKIE